MDFVVEEALVRKPTVPPRVSSRLLPLKRQDRPRRNRGGPADPSRYTTEIVSILMGWECSARIASALDGFLRWQMICS